MFLWAQSDKEIRLCFHPVLISRHTESMSWELKPFHSTTCCFHFLTAVSTAYNQRAEGHPATAARTTSACRIVSAAPLWLCFPRSSLSVNRETMAALWLPCGKFQVGAAADGNLTPAFSPRRPKASVISCLRVCCSSFISAHTEREVHTHPDLFSTLPSRPNHERNHSELVQQSALISGGEIVRVLQALNDIVKSLLERPENQNRHVKHTSTGLFIPLLHQ